MPREIVRINVGSKFPVEVAARFFATIAYPDNRNERERYHLALCRWYVLMRECERRVIPTLPASYFISFRPFLWPAITTVYELSNAETKSLFIASPQLAGW